MIRRPPISTLFPYPTLSRSHVHPPRRPGDAGPAGRPLPAGPAHGDHVPRPGPADPARAARGGRAVPAVHGGDRKSTRLNSSHSQISYAVFCLKKKNNLKPYSSPFCLPISLRLHSPFRLCHQLVANSDLVPAGSSRLQSHSPVHYTTPASHAIL